MRKIPKLNFSFSFLECCETNIEKKISSFFNNILFNQIDSYIEVHSREGRVILSSSIAHSVPPVKLN